MALKGAGMLFFFLLPYSILVHLVPEGQGSLTISIGTDTYEELSSRMPEASLLNNMLSLMKRKLMM